MAYRGMDDNSFRQEIMNFNFKPNAEWQTFSSIAISLLERERHGWDDLTQSPLAWAQKMGLPLEKIGFEHVFDSLHFSIGWSDYPLPGQVQHLCNTLKSLKIKPNLATPHLYGYFFSFLKDGKKEDIKPLIEIGLDLTQMSSCFNKEGSCLIDLFSLNRKTVSPILEQIIEGMHTYFPKSLPVLLSMTDKKGANAMHYAAKNHDVASMALLEKWGVSPISQDFKGNTAAHWLMKKYSPKHDKNFAQTLSWLKDHG